MTEIEDFDKDITDALDNLQRDIDTINKKKKNLLKSKSSFQNVRIKFRV